MRENGDDMFLLPDLCEDVPDGTKAAAHERRKTMNAKSWNDLKSRRDLAHRTARREKRAGQLQHERETPPELKAYLPPPLIKPARVQEEASPKKPASKPGFFRRIYRRLTGT